MKIEDAYALVVAGDHVRGAYAHLLERLELSVITFDEPELAASSMRDRAPDLAVLEVETGGCGLLRELRDRYGSGMPAILVSSARTTPEDIVAGFLVGADDYAPENMDATEFLARARRLVERMHPHADAVADMRRMSTLTAREREILALTSEGLTQKQIAGALGISIKTVGAHMQNVLAKLGVHSRVEAVAFAVRSGTAADAADANSAHA